MRLSSIILFLFLVSFTSCQIFGGEWVSGNGKITRQDRRVGSFSEVDVSGSIQLHLRQENSSGVEVETDENLIEFLEVYTEGKTLYIRPKRGYNLDPSEDIIVYATAPSFRSVEASGSCDLIGDNLISGNEEFNIRVSGSGSINMEVDLARISTRISGSGSVQLKGRAQSFEARVSGSGDVKCLDLITETTSLDLSGSSDASVTANKELDVRVSGSGHVKYKGSANVRQKISGSGEVEKIG